jgi:hypothetical protein
MHDLWKELISSIAVGVIDATLNAPIDKIKCCKQNVLKNPNDINSESEECENGENMLKEEEQQNEQSWLQWSFCNTGLCPCTMDIWPSCR